MSDFQIFSSDKNSLTATTAMKLGVSPARFANWRWQMKNQIRTAAEASVFVALDAAEEQGFQNDKIFNIAITPYAMSLMRYRHDAQRNPCPVRLQLLPRQEECLDQHGIADPLQEKHHSPVAEVVHVYPDRVAFCVAQLCPIYCRFCFRKRRDDEQGLHFNRRIIARGIDYIRSNSKIRDVLLTGGDPLLATDASLDALLSELRTIPHVEIIRFGTRVPVTLPYRLTAALGEIFAKHHPIWLNTHFNCAEELTPEACHGIDILLKNGVPVSNQTVLLRGINADNDKMLRLLKQLVYARVRPYYLFHPHLVVGTEHLRVPISTGLAIMDSLQGKVSGFAIPRYMLDTPSGKIPLTRQQLLKIDGQDAVLANNYGELWRERME
ncbi:MAG: KamA family radical SAM protein [Pseudomonadota bacterium]|nr:KamA family radical SAM protein [Pseudomonadota bacterium]